MFVIYIIVAIVITLLFTLIKVTIDERLGNSSMENQGRLSLKRIHCETHSTSGKYNVLDVSDDESFALKKEHSANVANKETVDRLSNIDPLTVACNLECAHDISDDLSTSEDVIIIEESPEKKKLQTSMFNWYYEPKHSTKPSTSRYSKEECASHELGFNKKVPEETSYKKQKFESEVINDLDDDDDATSISSKEEALPQVTIQHDIMIAGTNVKFPAKPYPCQIAVINSLIQGCNKEQNCLLESPTGSGKTLALLCGVLAWQDQCEEKLLREQNEIVNIDKSCCNDSSSSVDNFFLNSSQYLDECVDKISDFLKEKLPQTVPKVYYGTRTHKQLEQVVREFRKTAYRHKRMTILSSRDHTCIQDTNRNKTELCNELLDPHKFKSCPFYNERSKKDMHVFETRLPTPWDIEDLVALGEDHSVCPYFGARSLMPKADIIFCPYNYIVDPEIRQSMQINLKGSIVILDEAHNIEDVCREIASVNITNDNLANAITDCANVLESLKKNSKKNQFAHHEDYIAHMTIWEYFGDMAKLLKNIIVKENGNSQDLVSNCWRGSEFLELLNINNVGRSRFPAVLNASKLAIANFEKAKEEMIKPYVLPTISRETKKILEHLCFAMQMIMSDSAANDYRAYVVESMEPRKTVPDDVWISTKTKLRTMKFVCMNPAVIFAPLAKIVRSVILASGTLAPISSFQSELGTQFPHILNANHIIPKEQVCVRCLPCGPNRKSLIATYENVNSWTFQDELGDLILQVCNAVPYGVLCFFSSYNVMSKLRDRWKNNGMWGQLSELKQIFTEPRDNRDLPRMMKDYRNVIKESSLKSYRETSGAILFAVFRGKVAEGIDFSDNEARCVLTVGIPYSNRSNVDIAMKIAYNDANVAKGLLSGREWYTVNAFRALNQGLGRCIRHIKDWGAVLLVDERLLRSQNVSYLPKWIKERRRQTANYDLQTELEDFVALQAARERAENE